MKIFIIVTSLFLICSTCHTANSVPYNFDKKDILTQPAGKTPYNDKIHWHIIVSCLERNPNITPALEGWTIYSQSSDISRKIVSLHTQLCLGSQEQTTLQRIQAQRLACAIRPSLMEEDSELWKTGHRLYLEKQRLSILQQGKTHNLQLEQKKQDKIQKLELTIVELATTTLVHCLAKYIKDPQALNNIMQGKKP